METRASYFLVGLFVLAMLVGVFGFVVWLSRFDRDEGIAYYIYFRGSVTGLSVGSPVRYRGVPVGTVTDIAIDEENVELIQVTVALKPGTPIKTDTVASLQLQGITGLSFVQLVGGTQAAETLRPRPGKRRAVIPSRPSAIEQVFENAPEVVAEFAQVASRAAELLNSENQKRIAATLDNLAVFTSALARSSGGVEAIVADTSGTLKELRGTAESLNVLAHDFNALSKSLGSDVRGFLGEASKIAGGADRAVAEIRSTARSFERLANGLDQISRESREPIRDFMQGGLYDLSQLIAEARGLMTTLSRVALQLERDPARFLFGDQQRGYEAR